MYSRAVNQAVEAQQFLHEAGKVIAQDLQSEPDRQMRARIASGLAALSRAWCDVTERHRILRMKPLPKSVDVEKLKADKRARRPKSKAFTEEVSDDSKVIEMPATTDQTHDEAPGNKSRKESL